DDDFYQKALCHPAYCLVPLAVGQYEVASFVRRFLRHPRFGTHIRRRGVVVRGPRQVTRLASQRGSRGGRFLARFGRAWWGCSPQTKVILRGL
ncbi:MAG TPA: hypothetical protein VIJ28_19170, partial [Chloroflexota bacterium]